MRRLWPVALLVAALLAACASTTAPTGVATNPVSSGAAVVTPTPTSALASGSRTVLSPLGLNIRSQPSTSGTILGTAAQGAVLTVVDHTDQNGGWFKVQGQTVTGWVTGDPTLTAPGTFTLYQSSDFGFNVLYPQDWTFAASSADVVFHPVDGAQTIVVRAGATTASFGALGGSGFVGSGQQTEVVCGVTADLDEFSHSGPAAPTPAPGSAGPLALLAQMRLRLDATHALALDFNYQTAADLDVFSAFYNSMTFPFPECMAPASPTPS